mmetsp:Transcript_89905/g.279818  ORF Transcript_89905/g.279818 Transcript_89905/m.279818 type:complete len:254 (-) Transcript_89905:627-1388(-)
MRGVPCRAWHTWNAECENAHAKTRARMRARACDGVASSCPESVEERALVAAGESEKVGAQLVEEPGEVENRPALLDLPLDDPKVHAETDADGPVARRLPDPRAHVAPPEHPEGAAVVPLAEEHVLLDPAAGKGRVVRVQDVPLEVIHAGRAADAPRPPEGQVAVRPPCRGLPRDPAPEKGTRGGALRRSGVPVRDDHGQGRRHAVVRPCRPRPSGSGARGSTGLPACLRRSAKSMSMKLYSSSPSRGPVTRAR